MVGQAQMVLSSRAIPVSGRGEGRAASLALHSLAFCAKASFGCFVAQGARRPCGALGICSAILFLLVIAGALISPSPVFPRDKDKAIAWKPVQQALLRVDDQPVKNWNVFGQNKKGDPLLLEMNNRFLLIQVHERKIFELAAAKIEHKASQLLWDPADLPAQPLATSDWLIKDVGFAYRVSVRLTAENHVLDLQLPHPMDLRYL